MAKADAVRQGKPFGDPSADEIFEILIPEGAESGKIPKGEYILQLLSLTFGKAKSSGNPMYTFVFTIAEGDYRGMDFELYCPLTDNALWKLSDTLTALGVKVEPGTPVKVRPAELKGVLVRGTLIDDKTNTGREVSKLQAVLPHLDGAGIKAKKGFIVPKKAGDDEDEDEEFPKAKAGKNGRRAAEEEEDDLRVRARARARAAREENDEEDEEEEPTPPARSGKRSRL